MAQNENLPRDIKTKIRQFQEAAAKELLKKGGFRYDESWYQEFKSFFVKRGVSIEKYEDAVVYVFLGIDLKRRNE